MQSNTKHISILFVDNKWCNGNKKFGIAEWDESIQNSLLSTNLADVYVFHFDDYYLTNGKMGDTALLQKIAEYMPDIICLVTNKMPGTTVDIPSWSTFDTIKNKFKIPVIAIWADLEIKEQVQISKRLLPYTVLNLAIASTAVLIHINRPDKYLQVWSPRDPRTFNNPNQTRDIDVGYVGSPKKDRMRKLMYLANHGVKVVYGGGERQEHLTIEQYVDRYRRSKIALSFSRASAIHVVNTRPYEVMLCGAMLLEQESFELMKRYTPYVDYVPYSGKRDMLKKAKYYLEHDEEREKIALSGQRKTEDLYSAKRFWQIAIDRALGTKLGADYVFEYPIPQESLDRLPPFTAFKMKFLNSLCATSAGFMLYLVFNRLYWTQKFYFVVGKSRVLLEKILPKKAFEFVLKIKHKIARSY